MGLDTTHDCWHGAYSAFGRFREGLAAHIGIDLQAMEGFGGKMKWRALKPDPLYILLDHSDCEGEIKHEDCAPLAKRLRQLAGEIPPSTLAGGHLPGLREASLTFAEGLERADEAGEDVGFH